MHYVYEIKIGNKKQIGSTSYIEKRLNKHLKHLKEGTHWNSYMQNAYNKYEDFEYKILSSWNSRQEAYEEEQKLLDQFFGKECYMMQSNKALGAHPDSEYIKYWKGKSMSEDHKRKISESQKDKKLSDEHKIKISKSNKGKKLSEETKQRMKGPKSETMKKNMSEYAKNRSLTHKQKLSDSTRGKKLSEETKEKISKGQKGISKLDNAKAICQYDLDRNLINEFESATLAAKTLKVSTAAITNAANGKSKTSAGYIWKYKNKIYE